MQVGFDDPAWGPRNNPDLESRVAALIATWRAANAPVIHVHHDSPGADGKMRPGEPGNATKPEATPTPHERVFRKRVNSAFIGTGLKAALHAMEVRSLVVVGLTTNHCISTTVRMAGNLGFETRVARDATATFDRLDINGRLCRAADVHDAALSDLNGEFAKIVDSALLIGALSPPPVGKRRRANARVG
jgi:nicotinamidase-related amidase